MIIRNRDNQEFEYGIYTVLHIQNSDNVFKILGVILTPTEDGVTEITWYPSYDEAYDVLTTIYNSALSDCKLCILP